MRAAQVSALTVSVLMFSVLGCNDSRTPASDSGPTTDARPGDSGLVDAGTDAGVVPTWGNFAETFFATFCTSCHSPVGRASADFGQLAVVRLRLNAIRCGVAPTLLEGCAGEHPPGWFPIGAGPFPSDDERSRLVEWIDNGAPE